MKAAMLLSSVLVALFIADTAHSEDDARQSVGPLLWQPSMNVFRRFAVEPQDTGSGGIQYVVPKVAAVDALAKARGVDIDQPLSTLRGFGVRTVWLDDPDGITNYFAETQQSRQDAAAAEPLD